MDELFMKGTNLNVNWSVNQKAAPSHTEYNVAMDALAN